MVGTNKPLAGTCSTNQPTTAKWAQWCDKKFAEKATSLADAGKCRQADKWQKKVDKFRSGDIEVRAAGPQSAYVDVVLLLQKDKAAALRHDPSNVHRWEDANRRGQCIVTDAK
jgi:hypothetical protein